MFIVNLRKIFIGKIIGNFMREYIPNSKIK